jgi:hypothetical protein
MMGPLWDSQNDTMSIASDNLLKATFVVCWNSAAARDGANWREERPNFRFSPDHYIAHEGGPTNAFDVVDDARSPASKCLRVIVAERIT